MVEVSVSLPPKSFFITHHPIQHGGSTTAHHNTTTARLIQAATAHAVGAAGSSGPITLQVQQQPISVPIHTITVPSNNHVIVQPHNPVSSPQILTSKNILDFLPKEPISLVIKEEVAKKEEPPQEEPLNLHNPSPQPPTTEQPPVATQQNPLDLSCKVKSEPSPPSHNEGNQIQRSGGFSYVPYQATYGPGPSSDSGSATSGSSVGSSPGLIPDGSGGFIPEANRKIRRKEQNKTAAQHYRQRKKSFSDNLENELDVLVQRNAQLQLQEDKLKTQISRMRRLIEVEIEKSKTAPPPPPPPAPPVQLQPQPQLHHPSQLIITPIVHQRHDSEMSTGSSNESTISEPPPTISRSNSLSLSNDDNSYNVNSHSLTGGNNNNNIDMPVKRMRQNSWPSNLIGKDRKKEQNKLASRRFRERRKMQLTLSERESMHLEEKNKKLKTTLTEMERQIRIIKEAINARKIQQTA